MSFSPQFGKQDLLASPMTIGEVTSATLSGGNFTNFVDDYLVLDYDVPSKREVIKCTVTGTAISAITRAQQGTSAIAHSSSAKVGYMFLPVHYQFMVPTPITLTDAASIAWDMSLGNIATVTLAGNRTLANPTNLSMGTYILIVIQDGTGSRTLAYGDKFKWSGGTAPTLTTTANAVDIISFYCNGTNIYGSISKGFA